MRMWHVYPSHRLLPSATHRALEYVGGCLGVIHGLLPSLGWFLQIHMTAGRVRKPTSVNIGFTSVQRSICIVILDGFVSGACR